MSSQSQLSGRALDRCRFGFEDRCVCRVPQEQQGAEARCAIRPAVRQRRACGRASAGRRLDHRADRSAPANWQLPRVGEDPHPASPGKPAIRERRTPPSRKTYCYRELTTSSPLHRRQYDAGGYGQEGRDRAGEPRAAAHVPSAAPYGSMMPTTATSPHGSASHPSRSSASLPPPSGRSDVRFASASPNHGGGAGGAGSATTSAGELPQPRRPRPARLC